MATVVVAGLLGSAVTAAIGGGASALTSVAAGAARGAADKASSGVLPTDYVVDLLFRPASAGGGAQGDTAQPRAEASRILTRSLASGEVAVPDKAELARLIAARTGLAQAEAQKRLDDVMAQVEAAKTKAREAAEAARKAGVTMSLLACLSLVIGAFIASIAAALGGRQRDAY